MLHEAGKIDKCYNINIVDENVDSRDKATNFKNKGEVTIQGDRRTKHGIPFLSFPQLRKYLFILLPSFSFVVSISVCMIVGFFFRIFVDRS